MHLHSLSLICAAGKQDIAPTEAPAGPRTYAAPAFDAPDSDNSKKAAPILESEAEFVRYRRQRTVQHSSLVALHHVLLLVSDGWRCMMHGAANRLLIEICTDLQVNWMGTFVFVFYICAFGFYLWIRITKTLDLGQYVPYGVFVLFVECMGATTVVLYGTNLLWNPVNEIVLQESEDGIGPGKLKVMIQLHSKCKTYCGCCQGRQ